MSSLIERWAFVSKLERWLAALKFSREMGTLFIRQALDKANLAEGENS
jgi:hypothetical protein